MELASVSWFQGLWSPEGDSWKEGLVLPSLGEPLPNASLCLTAYLLESLTIAPPATGQCGPATASSSALRSCLQPTRSRESRLLPERCGGGPPQQAELHPSLCRESPARLALLPVQPWVGRLCLFLPVGMIDWLVSAWIALPGTRQALGQVSCRWLYSDAYGYFQILPIITSCVLAHSKDSGRQPRKYKQMWEKIESEKQMLFEINYKWPELILTPIAFFPAIYC